MVFCPGGLLSGVGIFSGLLSGGLLSVIPPHYIYLMFILSFSLDAFEGLSTIYPRPVVWQNEPNEVFTGNFDLV